MGPKILAINAAFGALLITSGALGGYLIKKDVALVILCMAESLLTSTLIYMFFMGYTGIWQWVPGMSACLGIWFGFLLTKPNARVQLEI